MLTLGKLKEMKPKTMFATGIEIDCPEGLFINGTGRELRWVAVRGGIHDWAVYCHYAIHDEEWITRFGDKVYSEKHIRKLVECDDEAFGMYRY